MYCAPCFLFTNEGISVNVCLPLTKHPGYGIGKGWRKLKDRIPAQEKTNLHKENYIKWKEASNAAMRGSLIGNYISDQIKDESNKWKKNLHRILDIILFLSERGLAFQGSSHHIGDIRKVIFWLLLSF